MSIAERGASESGGLTETIGEFAVRCLRANGVEQVFGIPGTHNIELYRGLRRHGIAHALTRHEQGAAYAADGYARVSGRPGVVIATSGPGATNCITGIANAYADSVPLLVLSPGAPRGAERRDLGFLHEAKDQRAGLDAFAARSVRVESQAAVVEAINQAFLDWRTARPRPVHIEIPTDIMGEVVPTIEVVSWSGGPGQASMDDIGRIVALLSAAQRPLVIAGGGSIGASAELTRFAERTRVPVVTTLAGKGVLDERSELSAGAFAGGSGGYPPGTRADVVIALGTELKHAGIAESARVVRVDLDAAQLHKHRAADVPILGDVRAVLSALLAMEEIDGVRASEEWLAEVRAGSAARGRAARREWAVLHRAVVAGTGDRPAVLTGDSSQISWLGTVQTAVLDAPRRFLTTDGYATLGYGLPAAIGASLAAPGAGVVALLGDGALMFSIQELATARALRLGLPVVVFDNGGYAEIRANMEAAGVEPIAVDLDAPDYAALAAGFHCAYAAVRTPDELTAAVADALTRDAPTVIRIAAEDFRALEWREAAEGDR